MGFGTSLLRGFSRKCCLLGEAVCAENIVNTIVFIRFHFISKIASLVSPGRVWDLIWDVFGDLWEHFGGLGGSWEQVGILLYFETSPGSTQIQATLSGGG